MLRQPLVGAVWLVLAAALAGVSVSSFAQELAAPSPPFVVDVQLQSVDQFSLLLDRAEQLLADGDAKQTGSAAVTFVLHGPVVRNLLRQNYRGNKSLVDKAASLSALGVIEIKACSTWMGANSVSEEDLQPFVGTVPYGVGEVERLIEEEKYVYF